MKPFDIELAKQGKPVCLRNGRKARSICFDVKNSDYPIIALVEDGEYEVAMYFNEREGTCTHPSGYDLMMASEKKTGWINIYPYPYPSKDKTALIGKHVFRTQQQAKEHACENCITTIPIDWEE